VQQRLAAAEEMSEPFQVATAQFNLGFSLLFYGNLDEAERRFLQSLDFAERAGDVTLQARSLTYLSILYRKRGLLDEVRSYIDRSLGAAEAGGMVEYITLARAKRSWLAWRAGNLAEAEQEGRTTLLRWGRPGRVEALPFARRQIAMTSSSNATVTRRVAGSWTASS
jgi:hypothetical protein